MGLPARQNRAGQRRMDWAIGEFLVTGTIDAERRRSSRPAVASPLPKPRMVNQVGATLASMLDELPKERTE